MDEPHNEIVTSFRIIDMARALDFPLMPWQEDVIIRHGEARYAQQERQALPKPHVCDTPDTGLPGDEWTCPECGRLWWADEVESDGGVFIEWRRVPDRPRATTTSDDLRSERERRSPVGVRPVELLCRVGSGYRRGHPGSAARLVRPGGRSCRLRRAALCLLGH
ncbi:hypothetical protein [Micromonospora sp. RTP1Z1]|uniref:hypothetical protein n=1 Tax=Micromonospora sp. RTP1Z1 TaxID=2994043 RepID=UPI0029C61F00|nr:hypothetical protein [Micromonospora sp. RTP1Z1]